MDSEYWKSSPFGENSIFHPSWEEKEKESRMQKDDSPKITEIEIKPGKLKQDADDIRWHHNRYLQTIETSPTNNSNTKVSIVVSVYTSGDAPVVYIKIDSGDWRFARFQSDSYKKSFDIPIPLGETEGTFIISAKITNSSNEKVYDEKNYKVVIGEDGEELKKEPIRYVIVDGYVKGDNVISYRADNKVKSIGELASPVIAIVLHRTVGSSISGAISHSKGTHFYIEGNRNPQKDGEIFQALSLKDAGSHIFNKKARLSHFDVKTNNSIGIEVVGLAYYKKNGKFYQNFGEKKELTKIPPLTKAYLDSNGIENYWDPLTDAQVKSIVDLVKLLMDEYNIKPEMILTHEEIQSKTAGEGQAVKDAIFEYLIK